MNMKKLWLGLLIFVAGLSAVNATQIFHESIEAVLQKTQIAMAVEVTSVSPPRKEGYWKTVDFRAVSTRVLFGDRKKGEKLRCRYSQGMPHLRGSMGVSPLVTGSGMEFNLKKGDHLILLIADGENELKTLHVLRVEPLAMAQWIKKHKKL